MTGTEQTIAHLRVIADYQAPFPDLIRVEAGESVTNDPNKKTAVAGWIWCTSRTGKSGWVPETYVEQRGTSGIMKCDYNATELTIHVGDLLAVHKEESGFYWVTTRDGRQGWVPVEKLEADPSEKKPEVE